jgi:hypothetical protein
VTKKIVLAGPSQQIKGLLPQIMAVRQLTEDVELLVEETQALMQWTKQHRVKRKNHPKITLLFSENRIDQGRRRYPITGEIGFRLMDENHQTINESKAKKYANRIKDKFAGEQPFKWRKGKKMYCYADHDSGYQLQLLCPNQTEAKRIIEQTLDIQGHSPDWTNLTENKNAAITQRYPDTRQRDLIYGQSRELDRTRPSVTVEFRYAFMSVYGLKEPVNLVDVTGRRHQPLA